MQKIAFFTPKRYKNGPETDAGVRAVLLFDFKCFFALMDSVVLTKLVSLQYENELNDEATFIEVKRKEDNFDAIALKEKVNVFTRATGKFKDYAVSQKGLSMTNM